jgi:hypothetical protein
MSGVRVPLRPLVFSPATALTAAEGARSRTLRREQRIPAAPSAPVPAFPSLRCGGGVEDGSGDVGWCVQWGEVGGAGDGGCLAVGAQRREALPVGGVR